ncbi:MAG TPA: hypothetical protein VFG46_03225 [Chryseolinea sp.]|nr:hypothetical protein [Chryseolinea sp.]
MANLLMGHIPNPHNRTSARWNEKYKTHSTVASLSNETMGF